MEESDRQDPVLGADAKDSAAEDIRVNQVDRATLSRKKDAPPVDRKQQTNGTNLSGTRHFRHLSKRRKILEFYKDTFEAVYVLLHPFIKAVSIGKEQFNPRTYPGVPAS